MLIISHCFNRDGDSKKRKMGTGGESCREAERQVRRGKEGKKEIVKGRSRTSNLARQTVIT